MKQPVFYIAGDTDALRRARNQLREWGHTVSPAPAAQVTHLLLPVPSFEREGILKGGIALASVLEQLPEDITVLGGNLSGISHRHVDFLKDEYYLNENAALTAHCTIQMLQHLAPTLDGLRILVIGWGRIGKHLLPLLTAKGAKISVAVRKQSDLDTLQQLGYSGVFTKDWHPEKYDVIINTAPAPLLHEKQTNPHAILIDLASVKGIEGDRVLWARGLPNKEAPDLSGILIAKTALRYALGRDLV